MLIKVENLQKTFKVPVRKSGTKEAILSFFKREYNHIEAISGITFGIKEGEMVGYIGPNGAGKSTTIKILSGILIPTSGTCTVNGRVPWEERKEHVNEIGVMFGQRSQFWWDVPAGDTFQLLKEMYRIDDKIYKKTMDELCEILSISDLLTKPIRNMSLGQRMRCEFAATLLHSPKILFLDEPTIGLDTLSKLKVREMIKKINQQKNVTLILTTHDLDDIESICDRVIMIGKGRIMYDGSIEGLKGKAANEKKITVVFKNIPKDYNFDGVHLIKTDANRAEYIFNPNQIAVHELISDLYKYHQITDIILENKPIEQIVASFYEGML